VLGSAHVQSFTHLPQCFFLLRHFAMLAVGTSEVLVTESQFSGEFQRFALIGNHLPRQCGIATFTTDLAEALSEQLPHAECFVLAMNDAGKCYEYPPRVRFEVKENDLNAYRRAADFLNVNGADVVCLQHEFGIFGGKAGSHVIPMLRQLRMPIVTTLHTVLRTPDAYQRSVLDELVELSSRLVVMSANGAAVLRDTYQVPEEKIDQIPHGIPLVPDSSRIKSHLEVTDRSVILTFGLLSPDKGLEYVIDAFPAVLARHPDAIYIVLGATHPQVKERHGEIYRLMLANRARRLGIDSNVVFYDRFVAQSELVEFLAAADIYITPYLNPEQSTSGTLAYATGAGKAVISTPYRYAQELLANGRGVLVPFRDPAAIADALNDLLDHPERQVVAERSAVHGNNMLWPRVAQAYIASFRRACAEHNNQARNTFQTRRVARRPAQLPEFDWSHLQRMTDSTGLLQHAIFSVPRYVDGYCLDDNARALLLTAVVEDAGTEDRRTVREMASKYLAFVSHAFDMKQGCFRNMMSYSRHWLEERGSDDSHGRALWALGTVVGRASDPGRQSLAGQLFHGGLASVLSMKSPRAWAYCLLGIDEYLHAFQGDTRVQSVRAELAQRLLSLYRVASCREWPWFEDRVTYANARLCQALIVSGARMDDDDMTACGAQSLRWLVSIQTSSTGCFSPVGSNGFYVRGESKAQFDQQPIEASSMVSACLALYRATGAQEWRNHAEWAFGWFFGENELRRLLYDPTTGGCLDGLHPDRVNDNQGAEATLSFLMALCEMRSLQVTQSVRPTEIRVQ
jgi:glycosyltransferase involved in cell wall biosynthesis